MRTYLLLYGVYLPEGRQWLQTEDIKKGDVPPAYRDFSLTV
jgi:hypothetical protein